MAQATRMRKRTPPFRMSSSRGATLKRDGKFLVGGRASFCWETFLQSRVAGVPGKYEIALAVPQHRHTVWHTLEWTIEEAEYALAGWGLFGPRRVARMRKMREGRERRGLPVG